MPPLVFSAVAQVEACDAQVIEEGRVIRSRAERIDAKVGTLAQFLALFGRFGFGDPAELIALPDGQLGFGVFDVARHAVDELLQRCAILPCSGSRGRCRPS